MSDCRDRRDLGVPSIPTEPQRHGQALAVRRLGAVDWRSDRSHGRNLEPGLLEPACDAVGAEAETHMSVIRSKELEPVRREVDDQHPPAGRQEPADLAYRPGRIVEEVQHLMDHDQVERVGGERGE